MNKKTNKLKNKLKITRKKSDDNKIAIPGFWRHFYLAYNELATFWRSFLGVVFVYGFVYVILVIGFVFLSPSTIKDNLTDLGEELALIDKAYLSLYSSIDFFSGDQASQLIQFFLFVIASLAFIWTLRKVRQLKRVKVAEAYYSGTAQIVPLILTIILLFIFLIPLSIGSSIAAAGLSLASSFLETSLIVIISSLLAFVSLWLMARYWSSFYIVSLPNMRPLESLSKSAKLTKGNRLKISLQVLWFSLITLAVFGLIIFLVGISLPLVTPYVFVFLMFVLFAWVHTFLFSIYRSLVDGQA